MNKKNNVVKESPELTIAFPTFNRPDLLERALQSLIQIGLAQYVNYEVVVCDNSDNSLSEAVCSRMASNGIAKLSYYKNEVNLGGGRNVLETIKHTQTKFIHVVSDKVQFKKNYCDFISKFIESGCDVAFLHYQINDDLEQYSSKDLAAVSTRTIDSRRFITETGFKSTHLTSLVLAHSKALAIVKRESSDFDHSLLPHVHILIRLLSPESLCMMVDDATICVNGNKQISYDPVPVFAVDFLSVIYRNKCNVSSLEYNKLVLQTWFWLIKVLKNMNSPRKVVMDGNKATDTLMPTSGLLNKIIIFIYDMTLNVKNKLKK